MIDFKKKKKGEQTMSDIAATLTKQDLYRLTDEMIDEMRSIIADAVDADVTFVPQDPEANDTFASDPGVVDLAWTLGHVIVHVTASSEESAALALTLARGIVVEGRSRYETPWEEVSKVQELVDRLEESRRMRRAMLDAWPDQPHLDVTYTPYQRSGPLNAIGRFIGGLSHDDSHLGQLREIMRQAQAARA